MTAVIIGIDPHKGSHTAVVVDGSERKLGQLRVLATAGQVGRLVSRAGRIREHAYESFGASPCNGGEAAANFRTCRIECVYSSGLCGSSFGHADVRMSH
jgi:hypothetical protein